MKLKKFLLYIDFTNHYYYRIYQQSQTIVFLDPLMLGGTTNAGITPPPYSSVTDPQQQHQEPQQPAEN